MYASAHARTRIREPVILFRQSETACVPIDSNFPIDSKRSLVRRRPQLRLQSFQDPMDRACGGKWADASAWFSWSIYHSSHGQCYPFFGPPNLRWQCSVPTRSIRYVGASTLSVTSVAGIVGCGPSGVHVFAAATQLYRIRRTLEGDPVCRP